MKALTYDGKRRRRLGRFVVAVKRSELMLICDISREGCLCQF